MYATKRTQSKRFVQVCIVVRVPNRSGSYASWCVSIVYLMKKDFEQLYLKKDSEKGPNEITLLLKHMIRQHNYERTQSIALE